MIQQVDDVVYGIQFLKQDCEQSNREIMMKLLQEKGLTTKKAKETYLKLDAAVKTKINQIYPPLGKLSASIDHLSPAQKIAYQLCSQIEVKYPSLAKWVWLVWSVPHYHAVGDVLGYGNSRTEFNDGNPQAGSEYLYVLLGRFLELGGVNDLNISSWDISDDTIMYLLTIWATLGICRDLKPGMPLEKEAEIVGKQYQMDYLSAIDQIKSRGGGTTTITYLVAQRTRPWGSLEYDSEAYGNGAAMRSGWIGTIGFCDDPRSSISSSNLFYAVVSAVITHNSAIAILGSVTSTYFTTLAITKVPIVEWPTLLVKLIQSDRISILIGQIKPPHYIRDFLREQVIFLGQWTEYIRKVLVPWEQGREMAIMSDLRQRYQFLKDQFSKNRLIAGSGGDDVTIFSYDTVLRSKGSLEKALILGCCHPGDSDTVGAIALSWFGAFYGSSQLDRYFNRWRGQLTELAPYDQAFDQLVQLDGQVLRSYYSDLYLFWARRLLVDLE